MKLCSSLVVLAVIFAFLGCSETTGSEEPAVDQAAVERGRQVYLAEDCGACHGQELEGTDMAPALLDVADLWSPDRLAAYLIDPSVDADSNPRLADVTERYELEMPGVQEASEDQVADLITFLMNGP